MSEEPTAALVDCPRSGLTKVLQCWHFESQCFAVSVEPPRCEDVCRGPFQAPQTASQMPALHLAIFRDKPCTGMGPARWWWRSLCQFERPTKVALQCWTWAQEAGTGQSGCPQGGCSPRHGLFLADSLEKTFNGGQLQWEVTTPQRINLQELAVYLTGTAVGPCLSCNNSPGDTHASGADVVHGSWMSQETCRMCTVCVCISSFTPGVEICIGQNLPDCHGCLLQQVIRSRICADRAGSPATVWVHTSCWLSED